MEENVANSNLIKKPTKPFIIMISIGAGLLFISLIFYIISTVFAFVVGFEIVNVVNEIIDIGSARGWDGVFKYLKDYTFGSAQVGQVVVSFIFNVLGTTFLVPSIGLLGSGIPLLIIRKINNKKIKD